MKEEQKEVDEMITEKIEYMKVEDKNLMNLKLAQSYKTKNISITETTTEIPKIEEISLKIEESKKRQRDDTKLEQRKSKKKIFYSKIKKNLKHMFLKIDQMQDFQILVELIQF